MKTSLQILSLRVAMGVCYLGIGQEAASRWLTKAITRVVAGLRHLADAEEDEDEAKRSRIVEVKRILAERDAEPGDKYTIDLVTWKGSDGSPVVELLEISPERFSALQYTASAKHVTVESLLGDSVRKAVEVPMHPQSHLLLVAGKRLPVLSVLPVGLL